MVSAEILSHAWLLFKDKTEEKFKYSWKIGAGESMLCGLKLENIVSRVTAFWVKKKKRVSVNL